MKYFIILLAIVGLVLMVYFWIKKKIRSLFGGFNPDEVNRAADQHRRDEENSEVLYDKDDVVVMKGEAGQEDDQE
ncbi:MAG: hypothetical protein KAH48_10685 [Chlorobi bacterium]|nr:hypothetical protein [Chlorobiota bacterium]